MRLSTSSPKPAPVTRGGVVSVWIVVVALGMVAIVAFFGELTTEGGPTNNPESERADERAGRRHR
jgi:hypothetical protein